MSLEDSIMFIRIVTATAALALVATMPAPQASAQDNILGGAIIGGGVGAALGAEMEPRRAGYYWYDGRCWVRYRDGSYHRASRRYCDDY